MLDLVVSGGTCVLPSGAVTADIGVTGGKIAVIGYQYRKSRGLVWELNPQASLREVWGWKKSLEDAQAGQR